jgi:hypothetical protein
MCFCSDKDDAGRQLNPAEIAAATTIQTPGNAAELSQKGVAPLDGAANTSYPRLPRTTPLGRLHPKARRVGAAIGGPVAIGAVGTDTRQVSWVWVVHRGFGWRRLHDHRFQNCLGLHAVVGPGLGHDRPQGETVFLGR